MALGLQRLQITRLPLNRFQRSLFGFFHEFWIILLSLASPNVVAEQLDLLREQPLPGGLRNLVVHVTESAL